ncbi:MAG: ABC transporter ATP-binding protein [Bacteroidales bacterium]|nr:ABC transporter ATP-binding protein [Bacteroidales bacterium]
MIEIKSVSFRYGKGAMVLEHLNLQLKPGSIYGLLGENGVGKTTLLKMMAGLLFPNEGQIRVLGFEPRRREAAFLQQVYFLPDSPQVEEISLDNYVKLNACLYPNFSEADLRRYVAVLEVDSSRAMHKLSFGQQKKAMLAFALACNTPVLLMDEPTNGLDIPSKGQLRRLIASAATDDKCFVISTHQVRDLEQLIDPIVIMERQRVLLNNSMEEIGQRLWFGVAAEKPANCLYAEPALGGMYVVTPRTDDMPDSKVQLEALFNAAIANRGYFQETFGQGRAWKSRSAALSETGAMTAEAVAEAAGLPSNPQAAGRQAAPCISPLKRFLYALRAEIFAKYKTYFLTLGVIFGLYMWRWISYLMSSAGFADDTVYGGWTVAVIFMILAPYMLYRDLYHPVKGFSFMMRPTGNLEKFGTIWVQSVIVMPVVLLLWCGLLDGIMSLLIHHSLVGPNVLRGGLDMLFDDMRLSKLGGLTVISFGMFFGPQSSVLWGTCFFKQHKLLKLIATYFGLITLFSIAVFHLANLWPWGWSLFANLDEQAAECWLKTLMYAGTIIPCLGLYVWSYFSFKRRQL